MASVADGPDGAVRQVAIVGAGMMGAAIAAANVRRSVPVVLADSDPQALATAVERIAGELAEAGRSPSPEILETVRRLVTCTTEDARLGQCDLVLESIVESEPAKQHLYARLEPHLAPATILASNTSTIPIGRLAAKLADGRRFLGLHFFHPVRGRPLVEVVRGPQTGEQAIASAVAYVRSIEKVPIVVGDRPGFLVNRLLFPYLAEAFELLLDGAGVANVERAATDFGMAMGPLRLMDEIGLDTVVLGGRVLWEAFPERIHPSPLLVAMYKAGRLGRKSQAGFFAYPAGLAAGELGRKKTGTVPVFYDPAVDELIAAWARPPQHVPAEDILARLLLAMLLEGARILEEWKGDCPRFLPSAIDLAVVLGLGFPAARGGLLRWADSLGIRRVLSMLDGYGRLGPRFEAPQLLRAMAAEGRPFYPSSP
jgi:3-hydroxyacyl-CoA dehydrogenase/enoyl-CoA hydratase/3-hydroxybutyryl-CoA epimerase/3-hydroxyacyl-CoA dehydrogenase/enoyl-CoA hydratase/3-hydroxybutyryl-CoA epimerase/enoyl-CoA isomerase